MSVSTIGNAKSFPFTKGDVMKRRLMIWMLAFCLSAPFAAAMDIPDAPLEPEEQQDVDYQPGSLVEFFFLPFGTDVERPPSDPAVSMTYDTEEQVFAGSIMQKDETFKSFIGRSGMLRWNTYLNVKKPGVHVFTTQLLPQKKKALSSWEAAAKYYGYNVAINGESKLTSIPSGALETFNCNFSAPGLYRVTISLWLTTNLDKLTWPDMRITMKVREPGSMGLRFVTRKDLLTPVLDSGDE